MKSDFLIREAKPSDHHPICRFMELVGGDFFHLTGNI